MAEPSIAVINHAGFHTGPQPRQNLKTSLTRKRAGSDTALVRSYSSRQDHSKKSAPIQCPSFGLLDQQYGSEKTSRHRFLFEIGTDSSNDQNLLPYIWLTWAFVLGQYTNSQQVVSVVAPEMGSDGKEHSSDSIDWTACSKPISIQVEKSASVSEALKQVKNQLPPCYSLGSSEDNKACQKSGSGGRRARDTYKVFLTTEGLNAGDSASLNSCPISILYFVFPHCVQTIVYVDRSLTDDQQNRRILRHFILVFNELYKQSLPGSTFGSLQQMTTDDIDELKMWNGHVQSHEQFCIDQVIEEQSLRHPSSLAVLAPDGELSYHQLDVISSSLAVFLQGKGVTSDSYVPICFEKSVYAIVALLAVCKAGGAFVLLDPDQPLHRLNLIIKQVNPVTCLTSATQNAKWKNSAEMSSFDAVMVDWSFLNSLPEEKVPRTLAPQPHHACYVTFTSGSTGQPKGIVIEHRNLVVFCKEWQKMLQLQSQPTQSRMLQFSSFAFDMSLSEIFLALGAGACVCMLSEEDRSGDLAGAINSLQVDRACSTPSVLRLLSPHQVPRLKQIVCVGESMTLEIIQTWSEAIQLVNGYGPSECTQGCFANASITSSTHSDNLGRPIGCVGWIVEPENSNVLLPIGAVGELVIEGPIVGRGYLNNPEKTKASFITDPAWLRNFRAGEGHRLYKTGDLVKYAPDGSFVFVGRKDIQVKIRGQRVELSEVEYQLRCAHPDILDNIADVIVPKGSHGHPLLVAFVSFKSTQAPSKEYLQTVVSEIERTMATNVPSYMVPSVFVPITKIPLSTSGKADRKALRQLASDKTIEELQPGYYDSSSCLKLSSNESLVRQLWSNVLGLRIESIALGSNFFRLGGDSILAMQLSEQAKVNGWKLPVVDIFRNPSLSNMALSLMPANSLAEPHIDTVDDSPPTDDRTYRPEEDMSISADYASKEHVESILVATDTQEDAVHQSMLPARAGVLYVKYDIRGPLNIESLRTACLRLTQWHEALRTMFTLHEGNLSQVILASLDPVFDVRGSDNPGAKQSNELLDIYQDDSGDFQSLGKPSLKFTLVKHNESHHWLFIRMSHAVIDGISMQRLLADLRTAYSGLAYIQYPSYRNYMEAAQMQHTDESYAYWRNMLDGAHMTEIVTRSVPDYIHPANCMLSKSVNVGSLQVESKDITSATLVKAAWAMVLAKLTGKYDIIFGHLVSGRNVSMPRVMDVVGPCIRDVPIRVQFQPSWTLNELLLSVQEQYLLAIPYENLGFPEIVRKCTNWPCWTRLSSYVQFQNVQVGSTFSIDKDISGTLEHYEACIDAADFYLMITPQENRLGIELSFSKDVIPDTLGQSALDSFCYYLERFSKYSGCSVQETITANHGDIQLPVRVLSVKVDNDDDALDYPQGLQDKLARSWTRVLPAEHTMEEPLNLEQSFFDVGGDFPRLVYLAEVLRQNGFKVNVNELVYRPLAKAQVALLAEKQTKL